MNNSQRSVKKVKSSKRNRSTGIDVLHKDLKDLIELSKAQENKFIPEVPDVPRIRFKQDALHNVELSYVTTTNLSTTAANFGALAFSLASCANYASYTACFDQYRIIQANVKFVVNMAAGSGLMYSVIDYDDANQPGTQTVYLGYESLKITPLGQIDERTLAPRLATAAYAGSTFNGYANMSPSTFVDAASPGVQYYGLKYYVPQVAATSTIQFIVTLMVQFRAQHG